MVLPVTVLAEAAAVFTIAVLVGAVLITVVFPDPLDEARRELGLDEHLLELARKERVHDVS